MMEGRGRRCTSWKAAQLLLGMLMLKMSTQTRVSNDADGDVTSYAQGMQLAGNGNLQGAVGHLRAAVRQAPDNALYQNDLGVTEMRLGLLHRARQRFLTSIRLNASFEMARANLHDLETFLIQERNERRATWDPAKRQLHALQPLPRLSVEDLEWPWSAEYMSLRSPFILTGAMNGWDVSKLTLDALADDFPNARVDFYPQNMRTADVKAYYESLKEARDQLHQPTGVYHDVDASEKGTYVQWNLPYTDWKNLSVSVDLPAVFRDSFGWLEECFPAMRNDFFLKTHWMMVLLGEEGAGMFNHADTLRTSSWQAQVQGIKRWHLCAPDQKDFMYEAGEVDLFGPPNYARHPKVRQASCFQDDVMPGEMLFYPNDYWHQTKAVTPTVSLSGSLVTPLNHRLVFDELAKECSGAARIFIADEDLCSRMAQCGATWDRYVKGLAGGEEEEEEEVVEEEDTVVPEKGGGEESATALPIDIDTEATSAIEEEEEQQQQQHGVSIAEDPGEAVGEGGAVSDEHNARPAVVVASVSAKADVEDEDVPDGPIDQWEQKEVVEEDMSVVPVPEEGGMATDSSYEEEEHQDQRIDEVAGMASVGDSYPEVTREEGEEQESPMQPQQPVPVLRQGPGAIEEALVEEDQAMVVDMSSTEASAKSEANLIGSPLAAEAEEAEEGAMVILVDSEDVVLLSREEARRNASVLVSSEADEQEDVTPIHVSEKLVTPQDEYASVLQ